MRPVVARFYDLFYPTTKPHSSSVGRAGNRPKRFVLKQPSTPVVVIDDEALINPEPGWHGREEDQACTLLRHIPKDAAKFS